MSTTYPVLYRVRLSDGEATGEVNFYCCEDCREADLDQLTASDHDVFYHRGTDDGAIPGIVCTFCQKGLYDNEQDSESGIWVGMG